jgi:hypothetical protein
MHLEEVQRILLFGFPSYQHRNLSFVHTLIFDSHNSLQATTRLKGIVGLKPPDGMY